MKIQRGHGILLQHIADEVTVHDDPKQPGRSFEVFSPSKSFVSEAERPKYHSTIFQVLPKKIVPTNR